MRSSKDLPLEKSFRYQPTLLKLSESTPRMERVEVVPKN